ncbi:MAG: ABC transporter permease [Marmoricola sp.]
MSTLDLTPELRRATRRVTRLARTNATLVMRNRLTLSYALVMPLLPLGLLFLGDRGDVDAGSGIIATGVLMALMFPVYYNLLSMFVSRRDELVLKRLRTGEIRDVELVLSMALPGVAITVVVSVLTVGVAMANGLPFPLNPLLLLVVVLMSAAAFAALALWTASWTRTAEAAQMTSMPVVLLGTAGLLRPAVPESAQDWLALLPGSAVSDLLRIAWFGRPAELGSSTRFDFWETWSHSAAPLGVLAAWTVVSIWLARRSMQWEPRS